MFDDDEITRTELVLLYATALLQEFLEKIWDYTPQIIKNSIARVIVQRYEQRQQRLMEYSRWRVRRHDNQGDSE